LTEAENGELRNEFITQEKILKSILLPVIKLKNQEEALKDRSEYQDIL
jgi:hypothetical protein